MRIIVVHVQKYVLLLSKASCEPRRVGRKDRAEADREEILSIELRFEISSD